MLKPAMLMTLALASICALAVDATAAPTPAVDTRPATRALEGLRRAWTGEIADLTAMVGDPIYRRMDAPASAREREKISHLSAAQVNIKQIGGDEIEKILTKAPGNDSPIGGLKIKPRTVGSL